MKKFRCECCGEVFEEIMGAEEEAREEAARDFPGEDVEDMAIVCDDCYTAIIALAGEEGRL